jgi:hypothetical protein
VKRPTPARELTAAFHERAMRRARELRCSCLLAPFDDHGRDCVGKFEAMHFFGRQELRNSPLLWGCEPDVIELIEWDDRNAALACEGHHRRLDRHLTPTLILPRIALPDDTEEFVLQYGLESLAESRFPAS